MTERPAWLAPALAYAASWLDYQVRTGEHPGCSLAVALGGEVVLDVAFGHADSPAGEALTPRHRFRVASHSKTFTAAAILKLREQGRLKLDDLAGDHVAGLNPAVAAATLGQLLSHTAGVARDGPDCAYWVDRAPFLDEATLRAELGEAPPIEANTRLKYSNHGFGLLGLVIEAITGESYVSWIAREIIAVAGLAETTPDAPPPGGAPMARGHGGRAMLGRHLVFPGDQPTDALAPATGFVSTAADLVRFFGQLSPTADSQVLSVASRREMTRPQWKDAWSPAPLSYGLGTISGDFGGWAWFGHSGGFQGYITRTLVVPEQGLAIACLTNVIDGMAHAWLDGVLGILKRFAEAGPPIPALADWTGRWWSVWGATDLVAVGDTVVLATPALLTPLLKASEVAVSAPDEGRISQAGAFASFGEPVRLIRDAGGSVTEVQVAGGRLVGQDALAAELLRRYGSTSPSGD